MPGPSRDRVTVDLRGVGERLRSQAAARRMTTGAFVRRAVVLQLDGAANDSAELAPAPVGPVVKLTLRVSAAHAVALATRACCGKRRNQRPGTGRGWTTCSTTCAST